MHAAGPGPRRSRSVLRSLCAVVAGYLVGCDLLSPGDPEPTTATLSRTALVFDAIGDTASLSAQVRDQDGGVMTDVVLGWSSSNPVVATVSSTGLVTSVGNGSTTVTATAGNASATANVSVAQVATALELLSGDGQSGNAGEPLALPLVVQAHDRHGHPAQGVSVTFRVDQGGGSVTAFQVITDAEGRAAMTWTLGMTAGQPQSVRSFVSQRVGVGVNFAATAVPGPAALLQAVSGNGQAAPRLLPLPDPLVVRAEDRFGNPVARVSVSFGVVSGGGSVHPTGLTTEADGLAVAHWTLGSPLGEQSLDVTSPPLATTRFTATASLVPDRVEVLAGGGQTGVVGEPLVDPPSVRVLGPSGAPVHPVDVRFRVVSGGGVLEPPDATEPSSSVTVRSDAGGVATVGGWILGTVAGAQAVRVEVPGLGPVTLTATAAPGPAAALVKVSGDGQEGLVGTALGAPLVIRVTDSYGNPVPGVPVAFQPAPGQGSVVPAEPTSDANGTASTWWTLGSSPGVHEATVSIDVTETSFLATVRSGEGPVYTIEIQFLSEFTPSQLEAFGVAVDRWEAVITSGLQPNPVLLPARSCGSRSPAVDQTVDDLLIFVTADTIDGVSGTLGQASVCAQRDGSGLPLVGRISFDVFDLAVLQGVRLVDVITHEIAHVMGFGTDPWRQKGLLKNPSLVHGPGVDTHFSGANAIAAFDTVGGTSYFQGAKVPVENQGGAGSRDSHWRESVLQHEVMTGFLNSGANSLSRVTLASLLDLGYAVDLAAADAYTLPLAAAAVVSGAPGAGEWVPIGDDVLRGPIYVIDSEGRIRGVVGP